MARRRSAVALGLALSSLVGMRPRAAFAQQAEMPHAERPAARASRVDASPPHVRLLVLDAVPEFAARVRGQVSDLDLTLDVEPARPRSTRAEIEAFVTERAAQRGADVVAWLGELSSHGSTPGKMTVCVWLVGHSGIHTRRVDPRADERSATLEAAAMVVRSAVRAVSLERAGGAASEALPLATKGREAQPAAPAAVAPEPSALSRAPAAPRAPVEPVVRRARAEPFEADRGADEASRQRAPRALRWSPRAGVDWSHAGLNPRGFWSATAGLQLFWGGASVGASARWGFAEPVAYQGVDFELDRRALLAEVGWAAIETSSFVLRPKLGAGAAWLTRTTRATAWGDALEPSRTAVSPLVAGDLVAEYRLAGPFSVDLHAGLSWLTHTTRYVVEAPLGPVPLASGWRWQPNAGVALGAMF